MIRLGPTLCLRWRAGEKLNFSMLKKMFIFRGVHHVRSLLNLQRPSQIGLLLRSGLCATRAILALDELIIGLDRSINDERLLITHRTYLRLISILQPEGTNDGES